MRRALPKTDALAALQLVREREAVEEQIGPEPPPHGEDRSHGVRDSVHTAGSGEGTETRPLLSKSAADLFSGGGTEVQWVAKPYVAHGALTALSAPPKVGKTTLVFHLARAVTHGKPFLGEHTKRTKVLYLTEERRTSLFESLRRAGLEACEDLHIVLWHEVAGRDWAETAARVTEEAIHLGAGLLVVDTLSQFAAMTGDSENDAGTALAAVKPLQLAAARGLGVVAVMHDRKGGGQLGDSIRGSSSFAGSCDLILRLARVEGQGNPALRKLQALGRLDAAPEEQVIELTDDGFESHGSETRVAVTKAAGAALAALPSTEPEAIPEKAILELLKPQGVKRKTLRLALEDLIENGSVQRRGRGVRGDPHLFFQPKDSVPTPKPTGWDRNTNQLGLPPNRKDSQEGAEP